MSEILEFAMRTILKTHINDLLLREILNKSFALIENVLTKFFDIV